MLQSSVCGPHPDVDASEKIVGSNESLLLGFPDEFKLSLHQVRSLRTLEDNLIEINLPRARSFARFRIVWWTKPNVKAGKAATRRPSTDAKFSTLMVETIIYVRAHENLTLAHSPDGVFCFLKRFVIK